MIEVAIELAKSRKNISRELNQRINKDFGCYKRIIENLTVIYK